MTNTSLVPHSAQVPAEMQPLVLQRPQTRMPSGDEFDMMMKIAGSVVGAANQPNAERMVPANIKTPEQALAIMIAGYERGLPPTVSLARVFIVNGRCEFDAQALMGIVRDWDETAYFEWHEYTSERVAVTLWRNGRPASPPCDYDVQTAKDSGQWWKGARLKVKTWKKVRNREGQERSVPESYETDSNGEPIIEEPGVWQNYTRDMLAWKAVTRACRLGAPDALNQINTGHHDALSAPQPRYTVQELEQAERTLPSPALHKALIEGSVTPAQVFAGEPDNDVRAEEDETYSEAQERIGRDNVGDTSPEEAAYIAKMNAEAAAAVDDEGVPDAEVPPAPPQEPVTPPAPAPKALDRASAILAINGLLVDVRGTWDAESYAQLTAECKERYPAIKGQDGKLHFSSIKDDRDLVQAYEWLSGRVGAPPPGE